MLCFIQRDCDRGNGSHSKWPAIEQEEEEEEEFGGCEDVCNLEEEEEETPSVRSRFPVQGSKEEGGESHG